MNQIRIRSVPKWAEITAFVLMAIALGMQFTVNLREQPEKPETIAALIVMAAAIIFLFLRLFVPTVVTFGEGGSIRCRWLCVPQTIDMEKISSVTFSLSRQTTFGGAFGYTFCLTFYKDGQNSSQAAKLEEHLDGKTAEQCMQQRFDAVQLMQLYRYIEEQYPEKAKGNE